MARYLVTGGAGYVGSQACWRCSTAGDAVVVLDDLPQGHRAAVPAGAELVVGRPRRRPRALAEVFATWRFDAVLHFAALSLVGESMRDRLRYIAENVAQFAAPGRCRGEGRLHAVRAVLHRRAVRRPRARADRRGRRASRRHERLWREQADGRARRWTGRDRMHGLRSAACATSTPPAPIPRGRIGEDHDPETHLVPLAIGAALGTRPPLTVFGDDYPTPDGTCIRDYIHVTRPGGRASARAGAARDAWVLPLQPRQRHGLFGEAGDRGGRARRRPARCRMAWARAAPATRRCWWRRSAKLRRGDRLGAALRRAGRHRAHGLGLARGASAGLRRPLAAGCGRRALILR